MTIPPAPSLPRPPIEPPATQVRFPDLHRMRLRDDVVAVGSDFAPGTLLSAYRAGVFPWPHPSGLVPWCSPDPRAIFPLERPPHWSRSLRRTLRKHPFTITRDSGFRDVMLACGKHRSEGTWILPSMVDAYVALHRLGWAHSVEVWEGEPRKSELVGGIYGIAIGGLFAGESMFHARTDASKIAFATLVEHLREQGFSLFDVQVLTSHLESLGCIEVPRDEYLDLLAAALGKASLF